MRLALAYRSLLRPSSTVEPSYPLDGLLFNALRKPPVFTRSFREVNAIVPMQDHLLLTGVTVS
jgi:hypothetical protein